MAKGKLPPLLSLRPALPSGVFRSDASGSSTSTKQRAPGVPFFRDPSHTVPTKSLYRRLVRGTRPIKVQQADHSGGEHIGVDWSALRRKVREDWKKRRGWTSIPQTTSFLNTQRTFLSSLHPPSAELIPLSHALRDRQRRADERSVPISERKPYLAGYLRPTHNNPPLPRLKPQPVQITLTIKSRIAARSRRLEAQRKLYETENEIKSELYFLRDTNLRSGQSKEGLEDVKGYMEEIRRRKEDIQAGYDRDERRKGGIFGAGVVRRVEEGKRRRQEWKRAKAMECKAVAGAGEATQAQGR